LAPFSLFRDLALGLALFGGLEDCFLLQALLFFATFAQSRLSLQITVFTEPTAHDKFFPLCCCPVPVHTKSALIATDPALF
jgi:hypothetical protein